MGTSMRAVVCAGILALAGCGDSPSEQALIGGVVGAGAAVAGNGTIAKGAAVGAAGNLLFCQTYPQRCRRSR